MDQQKRLFLAIGLSLGLTLLYSKFYLEPQAAAERARVAALDAGTPELNDAGMPIPPTAMAAAVPMDSDAGVLDVPVKILTASTSQLAFKLTTEGATIIDAVLQGDREREQEKLSIPEGYSKLFGKTFEKPKHMDLIDEVSTGESFGAISITGSAPLLVKERYAVVDELPNVISFFTRAGAYEIKKTFRFPKDGTVEEAKSYVGQLEVEVKNISANPVAGEFVVHAGRAIDMTNEEAPSMFGGIGNQASVLCRVGEDLKRKVPPSQSGGLFSCGGGGGNPDDEVKGLFSFAAIDQQYFLSALWPALTPTDVTCKLHARPTTRGIEVASALNLSPGQSTLFNYGFFLGPKDLHLLTQAKAEALPSGQVAVVAPPIDTSVDFGLWAFICKGLLFFLRLFHSFTGNWGIAIILLTISVKIVVLPLTFRSMVSAEKMKTFQPQMDAIKKKFPDDSAKQMQEMQKLGIDPFASIAGCLPLLLQMPIWIALFTTLRTSYELYGAPFALVWTDLTAKDPTYLLPLALGITMLVTQRLTPQMSMDKSQQVLLTWIMPIFFSFMMMSYPAGLALYIFTNNLLSIVQTFGLRKYLAGKAAKAVKA
jgi:YidC/Oxa1 family membrane protein insertase